MNAPELSRMVRARQLPADPIVVEADADERRALAKRFDLPQIALLRAELSLDTDGKAVRATGPMTARIVQNCAVSHDEFPVSIDEALNLRFVEEGAPDPALAEDGEIEIELSADDCDEIEYSGDMFDLGEAVAQSLGLAIDPYAVGPEADAARSGAGIGREGEQDGPLAEMLAALKGKGS